MRPSRIIHPLTGRPIFFHPVDVSSSEIKVYDQCKLAWYLKYVLHQRSKTTKVTLAIGGVIHEVLAEYYEPTTLEEDRDKDLLITLLNDVYKERLTMDLSDPGRETYRRLFTMVTSYWEMWGGRDWTLLDTEVNFRVGIFLENHLIGFIHGRFDGLTIRKDDRIWVIDHKTAKQFRTAHFIIDPQIDLYCLAGSKLFGEKFGGLIINYIRSKPSKKSPNFQRIPVIRGHPALTLIEQNLAIKLLDLGSNSPSRIFFATQKDCTWKCDYFDLCQGLRAGADPKTILERSYQLRPAHHDDGFD